MPDELINIGRFHVTGELGRGSMGIVHRAHDPVMDRDVAIKTVLLPVGLSLEMKQEFHERFLREAWAAGQLSHPSIVTIYDFNDGLGRGSPFIAMELVDGQTLHELIHSEGAIDVHRALTIGEALAGALATAHDAGIVHRDIKPANIIVRDADGAPKITDFGVARVNSSELTGAGSTYGSPAYMAPERLRGAPAEPLSDLFSLAVILYELLCGHRPFGGDDFASTCGAILTEPARPITERMPRLAPAFDRFFARALAKDPEERFQTGGAFRAALAALRVEQSDFDSGEGTLRVRVPAPHEVTNAEVAADSLPAFSLSTVQLRMLLGGLGILSVLFFLILQWRTAEHPQSVASSSEVGTGLPLAEAVQEIERSEPAPAAPAAPPARIAVATGHLDLRIASRAKEGALTLLIDGKQVYTTKLASAPVVGKLPLRKREEISASLEVPAGARTLLARYVAADSRGFEKSLPVQIEAGARRDLTIAVKRRLGPRLTLTLD